MIDIQQAVEILNRVRHRDRDVWRVTPTGDYVVGYAIGTDPDWFPEMPITDALIIAQYYLDRERPPLPVGENAQLIAEAMKGVRCLYIAVEEVIARDIEARVRRLADALEVSVRERDVLAAGFKAAIRVMELEAVAWDTEPLGSSHETGLDNRTRTARMNDESRRLAIRAALELVKGEQV